ncbi:MFS transporter [Kineococcus esterisolvens]|uniref:MFS transporter n=1 Tax=unclassified Kineococcus TaxID=2621656 RepID=UPI003D7C9FED
MNAPAPRTVAAAHDGPAPPGKAGALARYVGAATLARSADGGGVVAVVLLVTATGGPGWVAGLLGACITFPHLFGPFLARSLDVARDGRTVLSLACVAHGATLAAAVLLHPHVPTALTALLLIATGLTGPLLTGGISSRLPAIAGPGQVAQRRAQGWDVATYGLGGTIGPSIVAVVSGWSTPTVAALVLAAATVVAAVLVRLLPHAPPPAAAGVVPRPLATLKIIATTGALRRTLYLTMVVAASVAVLPIAAVASTDRFGIAPSTAGLLTAVYGVGNLAGSVAVMVRPLRGDADRALPVLALAVAVALAGVALAPTVWVAATAYTLAGVLNAFFFATTLAARSEYAPPAARGQTFVWVGALKITAGSTGTAAAGAVIAHAVHLPAALGAVVISAAAGAAVLDRRHQTRSGR